MKCNDIKEMFMDLIYDEISDEDKAVVEKHLEECAACKKELMELSNTSQVLQKWEIPEPKMNLVFVKERISILDKVKEWFKLPELSYRKFGFAFAGTFACVLVILSLVNFELSKTNEGFSVKMGLWDKGKSGVEDQTLFQEMARTQQETIQLITKIMEDKEAAQKREYQMTMAELARVLENRRNLQLNDLKSAVIESYTDNSTKIERQNEVIDAIIKLAGLKVEKLENK